MPGYRAMSPFSDLQYFLIKHGYTISFKIKDTSFQQKGCIALKICVYIK